MELRIVPIFTLVFGFLSLNLQVFGNIQVKVYVDKAQVGLAAAKIVRYEIGQAHKRNQTLAVIVPTGSTPLPMYRYLVQFHQQGTLDFRNVTFFNMDEYVGLQSSHRQSYAYYMHEHFYQKLLGKVGGVDPANIHIPQSSLNFAEAQKHAKVYRAKLRDVLNNPNIRVILVGGIGRGPAHIAFNDFNKELSHLAPESRTSAALQTQTRVVELDNRTREANKRFFGGELMGVPRFAITIGMKEILAVDRIVIMANDATKKIAVASVFKNEPSYLVPASLLRQFSGPLVFLLSKEAYSHINSKEVTVQGLYAAAQSTQRASLLVSQSAKKASDFGIHEVMINDNSHPLLLLETLDRRFEWVLREYVKDSELTVGKLEDAKNLKLHEKHRVIFLPAKSSNNLHLIANIYRKLESFSSKPAIIHYQTPASRFYPFSVVLPIKLRELEMQEIALLHHRSQVDRTAFAAIPRIRLSESKADYEEVYGHTAKEVVGYELYQLTRIENGKLVARPDHGPTLLTRALRLNARDSLVIMAPHPDDAEIGAAGLILYAKRSGAKTVVLNATSGSHSPVKVRDILHAPGAPKDLVDAVRGLNLGLRDNIPNEKLRAKIRAFESRMSLEALNPEIKVEQLDLSFYDHGYQLSSQDRHQVFEAFARIHKAKHKDGRLIVALPYPKDQHICHRVSTQLFLESLHKLARHNKNLLIEVLYYQTPWVGKSNLYIVGDFVGATRSQAIVASERFLGKAREGMALMETLGFTKAWALELLDR